MADRQLRTSKKKGNSSEAKRDISPYEPENNREVSPMIALHYAKHLNVWKHHVPIHDTMAEG